MPSHSHSITPPARNSPIYSVMSVAACRSTTGGKRRANTWMLSRCFKMATTHSASTARLVVLKPPAVEPGEPPTSIVRIHSSTAGRRGPPGRRC